MNGIVLIQLTDGRADWRIGLATSKSKTRLRTVRMRLNRLERKQQQIFGFPFADRGGRKFGRGNRMGLDRRHHTTDNLIQSFHH